MKRLLVTAGAVALLSACSCGHKVSGDNMGAGIGTTPGAEFSMESDKLRAEGVDTIYFAFDSSALSSKAKDALDSQVNVMRENSNSQFIVEGHCDERGPIDYNIALSERRANAVKSYLTSKGVEKHRLDVIGYGKERPIAAGHDEAAWSQNRRAVTVSRQ